jgi:hypothetical protein
MHRSLLASVPVMMVAMATMHEDVHERAREHEQPRQCQDDVPAMFRCQQVANHPKEREQHKTGARTQEPALFPGFRTGLIAIHLDLR